MATTIGLTSRMEGDLFVNGYLSSSRFKAPDGSIADAAIASSAAIDASKVVHQFAIHGAKVTPGTAVTAITAELLHIVRGTNATIVGIQAVTTTPATGADRTVTIDLKKGNAGSAFASVLTTPIVLDDETVARTPVAGTIASAALVAGDILELTVAVAGAAGAQAAGLLVTVFLRETPD